MWEHIFRGMIGISILIGICFILSNQRKRINWRLVVCGLSLQFTLAVLILKIPWFESFIGWISSIFLVLIQFTEAGSQVLFGDLLDVSRYGLAFKLLPTIIFVSALTSAEPITSNVTNSRNLFKVSPHQIFLFDVRSYLSHNPPVVRY